MLALDFRSMCGTLRTFVVVMLAAVAGCTGPRGASRGSLQPSDFLADTRATTPQAGLDGAFASGARGRPEPIDASRYAAGPGTVLVPAPVEADELEPAGPGIDPTPVEVGKPGLVLFDVKVGEVNNKPIFAAEFLDPIAQRLRALAYEDIALPGGGTTARVVPLSRWQPEAAAIITEQLQAFVENELVIAEGLASFTPGQRAGIRTFLGIVRGNLERQAGGSITRAVRNLGTGQTLGEYLEEARNRELIGAFTDGVQRSIVVTRSDVQRAYLQRYGDNRKSSSMTFRWIRVRKDDAEGAARVAERLALGEKFALVATDEANGSRRGDGGLWPAMSFTGEFKDATFFPSDPGIDQALRGLTPGEWAGPIEDERSTHWIFLEGVEVGYKTWAQAQSELRQELYASRFNDAIQREMKRLYEEAGLSDLNTMRNELLVVATDWFHPGE